MNYVDQVESQMKGNNPSLVSVIIIFFNAERFIREAIESVFAQTYRDWELLLVDDGSSDASIAIARQYAKLHPQKVRNWEHQGHRNCGKVVSRNLGIHCARGEYIAFLDADDVWLPHKLEHQVAILDAQPEVAMVYGLSQYWYSWTGKFEDEERDFVHDLGTLPNRLFKPPTLFTDFFLRQTAAIPNPSNILMRRKIVKQLGGFEETFQGVYNVYEDQAFFAKVCLKASVFASNECWDKYRQHPDSSCSVMEKQGQAETTRLYFLNWLARYLLDQGIKDKKIWQGLHQQQWQCRHPNVSRWLHNGWPFLLRIAQRMLPLPVRHWLWAKWKGIDYTPPVGWVRWGSLRRVIPLSREFGYDRGTPVDRYYIERFLANNASDIHGHVLEIADNTYTRRFGGDHVTKSDVLHIAAGDPNATIIGDLTRAEHISSDYFDCVILTQTLQFIYDVPAALRTVKRILKPGGVVLATVPGISQISRYDMERWGHYWSFTTLSIQRLFEEVFPTTNVKVEAHGNVLTAISFLHGLAMEELHQKELDHNDPDYEVIITVRAVKSANSDKDAS